jgi:hypothetical protein
MEVKSAAGVRDGGSTVPAGLGFRVQGASASVLSAICAVVLGNMPLSRSGVCK